MRFKGGIWSRLGADGAGGSAFNVRAESLRLGDFSPHENESLLARHARETGQAFTSEARAAVRDLSLYRRA